MIAINNTTRSSINKRFLIRAAQMVLKKELALSSWKGKAKNSDLSIALVSPKKMRELNRTYRRKDKVANVLSFSLDKTRDKSESELGLGEVVLCPQEVKKDAKKYGMLFTDTLAWMLIHGILHLLGYDHEQSADAQKMEQKEQHYLHTLKSL